MHRTSARPAPLDFLLPPSHSTTYNVPRRKHIGLTHPLSNGPEYLEAPVRDGLHTPPADDMATTYQQPQYSNHTGRQDATYPTLASSSGSGFNTAYSAAGVPHRAYPLSQNQLPPASNLRNEVRPASPRPTDEINTLAPPEELPRRRSTTSDLILPNLQIPPSINNSGGSLAEFAAQITCLFWFESADTLHKAEQSSQSSSPVKRPREEAIPSSGFKKWVVTILSTTQVTQNVILLALLFIYRLKTINPAVKGRGGSEYRLLTVALMLGNKFLDDNTYTNKTWAEVSGISVTEIHVMEVEFLSNMRYSLLASKDQWKDWQEKLGKFWLYCDAAAKAPLLKPSPPTIQQPNLPSPPHSVQASPPSSSSIYSGASTPLGYAPGWSSSCTYSAPLIPPLMVPDLDQHHTRKRSHDADAEQPAAKRLTRQGALHSTSFTSQIPPIRHDAPRLPVPNLTISTSQPYAASMNGPSPFSHHAPVLPPLSGRSMSTVYPSTPTWGQQLPVLTPIAPSSQHSSQNSTYGGQITPRRQSPYSAAHDLLHMGSSPISTNFPAHNSPSFYLQQRASPYKPVRHVNTLLYPPPAASMHDYSTNIEQMHYQPLGKRNDYRSGVAYSPHQQQPWNVLPQPNFRA